jgi:hypothetical protein
VAALNGQSEWRRCVDREDCDFACLNDVNEDGGVDVADVNDFVECLINEGCR